MDGIRNGSHTPSAGSPRDRAAGEARRRHAAGGVGTCHVAVVHSPRGVLLLSVAESAAVRDRDVAGYVRRQARRQLAPATRDRVLALLEAGDAAAAVSVYFDAVGDEWDKEWLHLAMVPQAGSGRRPPPGAREAR